MATWTPTRKTLGVCSGPSGWMNLPDVMAQPLERDGVGASTIALPPGPWLTLLEFLVHRFPQVGQMQWQQRMEDGLVLNEQHQLLGPNASYRAHSKVHYFRHVQSEPRIPFDEVVVYQDEHLVVADKPHFLPVTPGGRFVQETLLVRLKRKLDLPHLTPLHRIDLETAGLVAFSVKPSERDRYHALFRNQEVQKQYEAIAPYRPELSFPRTVSSRVEENPQSFMQMREVDGVANAQTDIELMEVLGSWARYRLHPLTGRKHQLRIQMSSLGLPIVGDRIYPVLQAAAPSDLVWDYDSPLRLLAQQLSFVCPVTGQPLCFVSRLVLSWPDD
jgi:tRNA pseudouridine32 synthase / 23S rRNA pseudouridine746 synthase